MSVRAPQAARAMLVMDLDGTLLDSRRSLSAINRAVLEQLGGRRILRVVATGRSLYAAEQVIDAQFPIDYLVFSSGAGAVRWPSGELQVSEALSGAELARCVELLAGMGCDFMVQDLVPHSHRFHYLRSSGVSNPDFERRVERYLAHATPLDGPVCDGLDCSHVVAIEPLGTATRYNAIKASLAPLHVVRTTSPLDHQSTWVEVYPPGVGKSFTSEKLRKDHRVGRAEVFAVGNDFNDEDLLAWAARGFVVANAPDALKRRFEVVPSNDEHGVAMVARALLQAHS